MQYYKITQYGTDCITKNHKHQIEQDPDATELNCRICGWWTNNKEDIKKILAQKPF